MKKLAIYPGSFDPFTKGHLELVAQARNLYDEVIILVTDNPRKMHMFSDESRTFMIQDTINRLGWQDTVCVERWDGLLTDYAKDFINMCDVIHIIRGLRPDNGAEEYALAQTYYEDFGVTNCNSFLRTVFFAVFTKEYQNISSTRIREYINHDRWILVEKYCPSPVYEYLKNLLRR